MEPPGNPSDSMTDITALLRSAVSDLEIGQMVHGPKFSLFEAMSALEMFDPKMDPRLGFNPEHTEPDCEYQWLTESDAIQAMDRLLQCESYFYSGTTLLHSVLLCAWLHDCNQLMLPTEHLPTIAVRAYSLAVLRCINRIVDALYTSDVVYEEDITLERFGFSLGESIPSSYILESIDRAISLFPEQSPVWLRLQYRRHLLHAFEYFFGNNSANFRHAFSYLGSCIESVDKLNLPEDECCPKISYFDLSVPCNYLASCPPRLIKLKSPKQSLLQQKDLFEQLMCLSYFPADSTADQLLQFSSAFATCLPANIIPRACLYLLSLSVSNIQPSYRLFLRCLSMNRSRAHRFTSKLFAACLTLPSPDFALMVLIHHVEAMLELELLSPQEYSSVFFILDALYSSLTAATMTRFMRGCMLLAKGLLLSYLSFSLCASQEQTPLIDQEYIFSHRFSLVYRHLENFPTCAKFQSTVSFIRSQELRSTIERASKYFEDAKSCFSDGHFVMPNQEKRARRLATIAGCNCASVKSLSSRMGQAISVRWIGDHTYPIIRWA